MANFSKIFWLLLRSARPRQWTKNLAVFAAVLFTGKLFDPPLFWLTAKIFAIFCLLTSSAYLINDVLDFASDRLHPFKKNRPIASGKLPREIAILASILGLFLALEFSFLTSSALFLMAFVFLILQLSYSLFFKKISQLDILVIAVAYVLRVYTGEIVTGYHLPIWLMLSVVSLSLFLATGKRRAELTLLTGGKFDQPIPETRLTLSHYKPELLNIYTAIFATSTFIAYGFYTFSEGISVSKTGPIFKFLLESAPGWIERKWLMITVPFVLYGIMRYLQLIYEKGEGESPERILLSDLPLLLIVLIWAIFVILVIYFF